MYAMNPYNMTMANNLSMAQLYRGMSFDMPSVNAPMPIFQNNMFRDNFSITNNYTYNSLTNNYNIHTNTYNNIFQNNYNCHQNYYL
jgi:hypothetical protein